jgi:hypothetical protein
MQAKKSLLLWSSRRFVYQTMVKWIKKLWDQVLELQRKSGKVKVIEMDEFYAHVKQRAIESKYELLSTELQLSA